MTGITLRATALSLALWAVGCAATGPSLTQHPTPDAVVDAADQFYAATSADEAREAVAAARAAAPNSPLTREVEGWMAWLEDRPDDAIDAWLAVLLDRGTEAFIRPHLRASDFSWSDLNRRRILAAHESVAAGHDDPARRARAAAHVARIHRDLGSVEDGRDAVATIPGQLPLTVIGPFDNEQGKGLQTEFEPELELDVDGEYDGRRVPVRWRTLPADHLQPKVRLEDFIYPSRWSLAYAVSAFEVDGGPHEVRITTRSPLAVWVNGVRVFDHPGKRGGGRLDAVVLPVELRKGSNQVLVKSANRTAWWDLGVRITGPQGAPAAVRPLPPDAEITPGVAPTAAPIAEESLGEIPCGEGPRCAVWRIVHADDLGLGAGRIAPAEALLQEHPESLLGRVLAARVLAGEGETGRAVDLLQRLHESVGSDLPTVGVRLGTLWTNRGRLEAARDVLVPLTKAHPDRPGALRQLAYVFGQEEWWENSCRSRRRVLALTAATLDARRLADCLSRWGTTHSEESAALRRRAAVSMPGAWTNQRALINDALHAGRDREAATRLTVVRRLAPTDNNWLVREARLHRLRGNVARERATQEHRHYLRPGSPGPLRALARLAYVEGDEAEARRLWAAALERDPDDKRLANRLDFLANPADAPWREDVPSDREIQQLIAASADEEIQPGADRLTILGHNVSIIRSDGSATSWVTLVSRALNTVGRDRLTKIKAGKSSRVSLAYAITPAGERVEASSVRGGTIRFRELAVGAVTVLQYRLHSRAPNFLSGSRADEITFDGFGDQRREARWIVWRPERSAFHEDVSEGIRTEASSRGSWMRHVYAADDIAPLERESSTLPRRDMRRTAIISTVPSWESIATWERELIRDAFRTTPELEALAKKIFDGAKDNRERAARLMSWIIKEIRYQKDYDGVLEGVKPHAAPVVVSRRYGDCKDKATLFIALARLGGIDAHYALIRTRKHGGVRRAVPMQQFNHVIVYLPPQEGFPDGRFLDPTVRNRDIFSLRPDDQGTLSWVYDVTNDEHTWREVPWDPPERNWGKLKATVDLATDGSGEVEMELSSVGNLADVFRRETENPAAQERVGARALNATFPESALEAVVTLERESLTEPFRAVFRGTSKRAAQPEGDTFRIGAVAPQLAGDFSVPERRSTLSVGESRRSIVDLTYVLPAGAEIVSRPDDAQWEGQCFVATQKITVDGNRVRVQRTVDTVCHTVAPADYPKVWARAVKLRTELVKPTIIRMR